MDLNQQGTHTVGQLEENPLRVCDLIVQEGSGMIVDEHDGKPQYLVIYCKPLQSMRDVYLEGDPEKLAIELMTNSKTLFGDYSVNVEQLGMQALSAAQIFDITEEETAKSMLESFDSMKDIMAQMNFNNFNI